MALTFLVCLVGLAVLLIAHPFTSLVRRATYPFDREAQEFERREREVVSRAMEQRFETLKHLSPREFEFAIGKLFEAQGWSVEVTRATGDGGRDLILRKGNRKQVVEVKLLAPENKITSVMIRSLHSAAVSERAEKGIFVTTSSFTEPAREIAEANGIALIDGCDLKALLLETYPEVTIPKRPRSMCSRCGAVVEFKTLQDVFDASDRKVGFLANAIRDKAWRDRDPRELLGQLQDVDLGMFLRAWRAVQEKLPALQLKDFDLERPLPLCQPVSDAIDETLNCPNGHVVNKPAPIRINLTEIPWCKYCGVELRRVQSHSKPPLRNHQLRGTKLYQCSQCNRGYHLVNDRLLELVH